MRLMRGGHDRVLLTLAADACWACRVALGDSNRRIPSPPPSYLSPFQPIRLPLQSKSAKLEMFPGGVLGRTVSIANTRIFRIEQIGPSVKKVPEEFKIYNIPRRPVLAGDMYLVIAEIGSFRVARLGVEHPIHATPGFWKKL